jgi:hypothetical protein
MNIHAITISTFLFAVLCTNYTSAQFENVQEPTLPETTEQAFKTLHPGAKDAEWEWEDDHYEVEFVNENGMREELWYDTSDNVIRDKMDISKDDLPDAVKAAIKENYPEYRIDDPQKIDDKGHKTLYEVELESFTQEWHIWFDKNGVEVDRIAD